MEETSSYVPSPVYYYSTSSTSEPSQTTSDTSTESSGQIVAHYFLCLTLIIVWFAAIKACVALCTKPTCLCECCTRVCCKCCSPEPGVHPDVISGAVFELNAQSACDLGPATDQPPNYETALTMPRPHDVSATGGLSGDINIAYTHSVINLSHVEPGVVLRVNGVGIATTPTETANRIATDTAASPSVEPTDVTQSEDTLGASNPAMELPTYDEALSMAMTRPSFNIDHVFPVQTAHAPESVAVNMADIAVSGGIFSVSNPVDELPSYDEALHMAIT